MKIFNVADIHTDFDLLQAERCCDFVTEQVEIHQPDLIAIPGDIYDSQHIKLDSPVCRFIFRWISNLASMAP